MHQTDAECLYFERIHAHPHQDGDQNDRPGNQDEAEKANRYPDEWLFAKPVLVLAVGWVLFELRLSVPIILCSS